MTNKPISKTRSRWYAMRRRCNEPKFISYPYYGGKGITVCAEWDNSYESFVSDMGECPGDGYFLDRIDGSKGYHKNNCRWVTRKESNSNRKNVRWVTHNGCTQHVDDWIKTLSLNKSTVCDRLAEGWDSKQALGIYPPPIPLVSVKNKLTGRIVSESDYKHSVIGFSSLSRTVNCPGWVSLSEGIPKTTSVYAEEGTLYHSYIEQAIYLREQPRMYEELLESIEDNDMSIHVDAWINLINTVEKQHITEPYEYRRCVEKKVYLTEHLFGTLDYGLVVKTDKKTIGVICDAKYGAGVRVEPVKNYQLIGYALALDNNVGGIIDEFHLCVFQPRVSDDCFSAW